MGLEIEGESNNMQRYVEWEPYLQNFEENHLKSFVLAGLSALFFGASYFVLELQSDQIDYWSSQKRFGY